MNLSLVSQKPSAATTLGVLAALRAASGYGDYFTEVRVAQPDRWQPSKEEAAILLLEEDDAAWPEPVWPAGGTALGLPVLPLLVHRQYDSPPQGPDVRDPRFYFVSNGIVLDETELADPACSLVLQSKLESYFPLLSRLILLRQRQPLVLCSCLFPPSLGCSSGAIFVITDRYCAACLLSPVGMGSGPRCSRQRR